MSAYPTTFSEAPKFLDLHEYQDRNGYLGRLQEQGYVVQLGMTPEDVVGIQALAQQASIRKYCFNDPTPERFGDILGDTQPTERWLLKGRQVFLLKQLGTLAGYGWSGPSNSKHILEYDTTCAVRLNEEFQGKGLATPFLGTIVGYTMQKFPDSRMWIEAWESNEGGLYVDKKLGFKVAHSKLDSRPSADGGTEDDTRLSMILTEAA